MKLRPRAHGAAVLQTLQAAPCFGCGLRLAVNANALVLWVQAFM
jgi:hypothetical protein